jgi:hypothetical protein
MDKLEEYLPEVIEITIENSCSISSHIDELNSSSLKHESKSYLNDFFPESSTENIILPTILKTFYNSKNMELSSLSFHFIFKLFS